jgi:hypothetical protein
MITTHTKSDYDTHRPAPSIATSLGLAVASVLAVVAVTYPALTLATLVGAITASLYARL